MRHSSLLRGKISIRQLRSLVCHRIALFHRVDARKNLKPYLGVTQLMTSCVDACIGGVLWPLIRETNIPQTRLGRSTPSSKIRRESQLENHVRSAPPSNPIALPAKQRAGQHKIRYGGSLSRASLFMQKPGYFRHDFLMVPYPEMAATWVTNKSRMG